MHGAVPPNRLLPKIDHIKSFTQLRLYRVGKYDGLPEAFGQSLNTGCHVDRIADRRIVVALGRPNISDDYFSVVYAYSDFHVG